MRKKCDKCGEDKPLTEYEVVANRGPKVKDTCRTCETGKVRTCWRCKVKQPLSEFYLTPSGRPRQVCKLCVRENSNRHYHNDSERLNVDRYWRRVKSRYGASPKEIKALDKAQGKKCAICESPFKVGRRPDVDHDHDTGKVRGLLCNSCNRGIAWFEENIDMLESAIEYLRKHQETDHV